MTTMVWTHLGYLAVSAAITVWVGRTLRKHGKVFASDGDETQSELLDSFSHLLEVGFYLVNFGAINITLKYGGQATDVQTAIELLSTKIGVILFVLGFVHLTMTAVFSNIRKQKRIDARHTEHSLDRLNTVRTGASV